LKDEVSSVRSISVCCRIGGIQSEVVCRFFCFCALTFLHDDKLVVCMHIEYHFLRLREDKVPLVGYNVCLGLKEFYII